jgi:hypothetical protein
MEAATVGSDTIHCSGWLVLVFPDRCTDPIVAPIRSLRRSPRYATDSRRPRTLAVIVLRRGDANLRLAQCALAKLHTLHAVLPCPIKRMQIVHIRAL